MTVTFGYTLKDYISTDDKIKEYIHTGYKKLAEKYDDISYYKNKTYLDISTIFVIVDTIGEVYHGVSISVSKTSNISDIKNRLEEIIDMHLDVTDISLWVDEKQNEDTIYIECEEIILKLIEEQGDLESYETPEELYDLYKS